MARLDAELVARGLAKSRERAKEMIKSGSVIVDGKSALKPSQEISSAQIIQTLAPDMQYVGRGALKLEKAVEEFGINLDGKICIDIGASTGGFTDFMLRNGAAKVFAIDVGHGQLAESLRADSRVVNAEGTDIRNVDADFIGGEADFISADVSFISLKKILPKIHELLKPESAAAVLIKPQFEAGVRNIGKKGIVKDKSVHADVLSGICEFAASIGLAPKKLIYSPVKGGSGNIEYMAMLVKTDVQPEIFSFRQLVDEAFRQL